MWHVANVTMWPSGHSQPKDACLFSFSVLNFKIFHWYMSVIYNNLLWEFFDDIVSPGVGHTFWLVLLQNGGLRVKA